MLYMCVIVGVYMCVIVGVYVVECLGFHCNHRAGTLTLLSCANLECVIIR